MKASALRELTKDELVHKLTELREALFNLQFQHATGQLENTAQLYKTKRTIARILSVLTETERKTAA
ncbi:MAG TPA: 50S ribosomal protein L29 [Syntrophobacteraceae bacterium]|nr:50S ribosomal protein L29 [Syntrophobacteraceae bacterium]